MAIVNRFFWKDITCVYKLWSTKLFITIIILGLQSQLSQKSSLIPQIWNALFSCTLKYVNVPDNHLKILA